MILLQPAITPCHPSRLAATPQERRTPPLPKQPISSCGSSSTVLPINLFHNIILPLLSVHSPPLQHHSSPLASSFTPFATSFIPFRVPIHPFHTMKRALLAARKEQLLACERRFLAMRKAFPPKSLRCDGGPRKSLGDAVCLSFVFWLMVTHNATNKKGVKPNLSKVPPQFSSHWQDAVRMSCLALP